jgi:hypothetical protein
MGGLSELAGGVGAGQGSSVGNAGPATSGETGGNVFHIASGGGSDFNPFGSSSSGISQSHMLAMAGGALLIGFLLIRKNK